MSSEEEEMAAWARREIAELKAAAEAVKASSGPERAEPMTWPAAHMVLIDPRDVIADCEAKLAILDEHSGSTTDYGAHRTDGTWAPAGSLACDTCGYDDGWAGVAWPCRTVGLLAAGLKHRPGYRPEWAPDPIPARPAPVPGA